MSKENAFHNMMYFKCLARLKNGEVFYLVENHSDFWGSGIVNHTENPDHIEQSIKFAKTIVDLERRINERLPLSRKEITENELRCVEELVNITLTGFVRATALGVRISLPMNKIDVNGALPIFDTKLTKPELHWEINLGNKLLVSSKPFIIKREEANVTYLEVDPEGKCVFIFEDYYDGKYSEVFEKLEEKPSNCWGSLQAVIIASAVIPWIKGLRIS